MTCRTTASLAGNGSRGTTQCVTMSAHACKRGTPSRLRSRQPSRNGLFGVALPLTARKGTAPASGCKQTCGRQYSCGSVACGMLQARRQPRCFARQDITRHRHHPGQRQHTLVRRVQQAPRIHWGGAAKRAPAGADPRWVNEGRSHSKGQREAARNRQDRRTRARHATWHARRGASQPKTPFGFLSGAGLTREWCRERDSQCA
jgi:hypothetical protein